MLHVSAVNLNNFLVIDNMPVC